MQEHQHSLSTTPLPHLRIKSTGRKELTESIKRQALSIARRPSRIQIHHAPVPIKRLRRLRIHIQRATAQIKQGELVDDRIHLVILIRLRRIARKTIRYDGRTPSLQRRRRQRREDRTQEYIRRAGRVEQRRCVARVLDASPPRVVGER